MQTGKSRIPRRVLVLALTAFVLVPGLTFPGAGRAQMPTPSASEAQVKQAPPTPLAEQKAALGDEDTWNPEWDKIIEDALPQDLLWSPRVAKELKGFCPRFSAMTNADKRAYWAYFFQALAGAEAGLRSTADVRHTEREVAVRDAVTHRMVRAEGLLQLTYEDAERYGCEFDWEQDRELPAHDPGKTILEPRNNLLCGVRILTRQLIDQRKPLLSKSSYWSTLRPGWPGYSVFLKQMSNVPEECGRPRNRHWLAASRSASGSQPPRSAFASSVPTQ
jgi:hypothetical protein